MRVKTCIYFERKSEGTDSVWWPGKSCKVFFLFRFLFPESNISFLVPFKSGRNILKPYPHHKLTSSTIG